MTTATPDPTTMTPLAEPAQALIDARLDTIERMLLGQVPRADRLAIVREVEAQVHEHLLDRDPAATDRDAALAALARLDPPEAYLPDEGGAIVRSAVLPRIPAAHRADRSNQVRDLSRPAAIQGVVSGIMGLLSLVLVLPLAILFYFLLTSHGSVNPGALYLVVFLDLLTIVISTLAIVFASIGRVRGTWAVAGLVLGVAGLMPAVIAGTILLFELVG